MCDRCKTLETQLMQRPQRGDVEHVRERMRRKNAMYEATLARNEVLKARLDEAHKRILELKRNAVGNVVAR